jgi:glucose/arabinose dehydrogenase
MLVTERSGQLRIVEKSGRLLSPISGVPPVRVVAAEGLHDVALDPDFARNRFVYLSYFAPPAGEPAGPFSGATWTAWLMLPDAEREAKTVGVERVARARLSDDGTRLENVQVILEGGNRRLRFSPDGTLLVTSATRAGGGNVAIDDLPQRLNGPFGKVLRINRDGSIPRDNPWVDRPGARADLFAIGVRDPEGAAIHPTTGELWTVEHGPMGGDELNLVRKGMNLGFPAIGYGRKYTGEAIGEGLTARDGLEQPIYFWVPSIGPSGLEFYTGDRFPQWKGNVFLGSMPGQHLVRLVLDGSRVVAEERLLSTFQQRIRDVRQGPDGLLYLLTDEDAGRILRIVPPR